MRNIIIWGGTNYKWLWVPFAARIKNEHAARVHFICTNEYSIKYWKAQDAAGVIDTFTTTGHFFLSYDQLADSSDEIGKQARAYEEKYGVYVSDILQADRHLGRGFFAAGIGHPRSQLSAKSDYVKSMNACVEAFKFWEEYFNRIQPDLVIGFVSGIVGKTCTAVAQKRGIPVRALTHAGYQEYFYWSEDEYYSNSLVEKYFNDAKNVPTFTGGDELKELKRVPWTHANYQDTLKQKSLRSVLRLSLRQIKIQTAKRLRKNVTGGNYLLRDNLKFFWQRYCDIRAFDRMKLAALQDLEGKAYVLYPIHMEPETALGMKSPEFNEQLALIELIAKNLPAGVLLVVKEHLAAIGRRPKDFYKIILDIPNVAMVSPNSYAVELAKGAKAVAVITSTLGAEAAMLGIPVLSFGLHNVYNFLKHVHVVTSWMKLRPLLKQLCSEVEPSRRQQWVDDGLRFLDALKKTAIDLSWSDYVPKDREPATEREIQVFYASLMGSLKR
ncbi:hypothetical protein HY477_03430 [Candidatus Uhrbacteria bacterium]|nr:hypothetical protein [Candidatus Uhrbacteria bacterium]